MFFELSTDLVTCWTDIARRYLASLRLLFVTLALSLASVSTARTEKIAAIPSTSTDGSSSDSVFELSITSDQMANALTTASDIELSLYLVPQESHQGLQANVYSVVNADGQFFKLTEDGSYSAWDGSIKDLTPFVTNQTLSNENRFTLLKGKMIEADSYFFYIAYNIEGESRLLFTPDPAQVVVSPSGAHFDEASSQAAETFEAKLESAVVQKKCIFCHVEGGLARNSSLQFQRTNTASALNNFETLSAYLDEKGSDILLSKISGGNDHAGGIQLSQDSDGYRAFQQVIKELNELDNTTYYAFGDSENNAAFQTVSFLTDVTFEQREITLRRATLLLQGRLPTEEESEGVVSDATLRSSLRNLMQGPEFREFVVKATNDRLLIDGSMFGPLNEGLSNFLYLRNFAYEHRESDYLGLIKRQLDRAAWQSAGELIAYIVENEKPYTEILTADYMMMNPLMNKLLEGDATFDERDNDQTFKPAKITGYYYNKDVRKLELGLRQSPYEAIGTPITNYPHSGLLTDFGFLNRFPTTATNRNRARARWVFYHFLDIDIEKSSQRPTDEAALKDQNNPTMNNPNCSVCHAILDPVAGAFHNWNSDNLYRPNGVDTLDEYYKYPEQGQPLYRNGDQWYRDMREPGLFDVKISERDNTLTKLAELIIEEDGFYRAAPKFWWSAIFGEPMIGLPAVESDQGYAEKYAAYSAQQSAVNDFASTLREDHDAKDMLTEMLMSAWFSGEQSTSNPFTEAHSLSYLGSKQLLDPEQLSKKTRSLTGVAWRASLTPQGIIHWPSKNIGVLLGGIDGSSVTERAVELTPMISTLMLTHAAETSCLATIREFELPKADRRLFTMVDELTSPEGSILENIVVPSTDREDFKAMSITADLPKGPASFRVDFTNDYADCRDGKCIEDRNMLVKSLSVTKPSGDIVSVPIRNENIRYMNPGCRQFTTTSDGTELLGWWGNCYAEFSIQLTEPGQHTFTAVLSADIPSITGGFAEGAMSAWSNTPLGEIESLATDKIKKQIEYLYDRLLGAPNETSPSDIDIAYNVYLASRQRWLSNSQLSCNLWNDGLMLKEYLTPEEFNVVQIPQDEHSRYFQTDWDKIGQYHARFFQDENGAKYSWTAVLALILSNFHYLHE